MEQDFAREIADMRAQILRLTDAENIRKLTSHYMQAMHDARWDDAIPCFADDARYDHGHIGHLATKADIARFYNEFMGDAPANSSVPSCPASKKALLPQPHPSHSRGSPRRARLF